MIGRRGIVPALLVAAVVAVAVLVALAGGGTRHELWVDIPDATGLYAGEPIREAGIDVGGVASVEPIDGGRRARVGLSFGGRAWPIQHGTQLRLRWGGTISYLNYYVDLIAPVRSGQPYPDGATLPRSTVSVPVEFDSLIDDFTPRVRAGMRSLLAAGGDSFTNARPGLEATLARTPPALTQANLLLADLNRSRSQLTQMIGSTGRVVDALDTAQPSTEQLVSGAAGTLHAVAAQATALQHTIADAPAAFTRVDGTLGTADRTLDLAGRVTTQLAPGVTQLHETVRPLDQLLAAIEQVAPDAESTLTTARRSAPRLTALLRKATALMPTIDSAVGRAIPELDCIRPYTPDIVSFFTNWSAFMSTSDGSDYIPRVVPSAITGALSGAQQETAGQAVSGSSGLTDAFPQPPGYAAGQPWFQPQCGITQDSLIAADDPEADNPNSSPFPAPTTSSQAR